MLSVVIPVYMNEDFVRPLLKELEAVARAAREQHGETIEIVFVVDGSPDSSYALLSRALPTAAFPSQLIEHSRNFGAFAAIRTGLAAGRGDYFSVIAADLQEPPELILQFVAELASGRADVVVGRREGREDPVLSRAGSNLFWWLYRTMVVKEVPRGGVDVFGCTRTFRDRLLSLSETHSSLIGQLFWIGYRRVEIPYNRRARAHGKSAWTLRKKMRYLADSIFAFTDLPIRILLISGALGLLLATTLGTAVVAFKLAGLLDVPGYAATILVILFFGALNTFGLGIVGSYAARAYENSKGRPIAVVRSSAAFDGTSSLQSSTSRLLVREKS
jgi:polyisoprenyl-phosphate glycosyltransferase